MKKLLFVIIIICITIFSILRTKIFNEYLVQTILNKINSEDVSINIKESSFGLFSSKFKEVKLIYSKKLPFSLVINCEEFSLYNQIYFLLSRPVNFNAKCYEGNIDGRFLKDTLFIDNLVNLKLNKQENLSDLGIQTGTIELKNLFIKNNQYKINELNISNLNSKNPIVIPSLISNLPLNLTLPIEDFNLKLSSSYPHLKIENLDFNSSLGNLSGVLEVINKKEIKTNLNIKLKPAGSLIVGNFLPLISNNLLTSNSSIFNVQISGDIFSAKFSEIKE